MIRGDFLVVVKDQESAGDTATIAATTAIDITTLLFIAVKLLITS